MRIIDYSSIKKVLVMAPGPEEMDVSGDISLVLKKRGCAGRWEGDMHIPCDGQAAPFCSSCGGPPDPCIRCRGECPRLEKTCNVEHSVYLAAFAPDLIKVGVTKTSRLEKRLMEQGADFGLEIERYADGELARRRERILAEKYPDRVTFLKKVDGVSQSVKYEAMSEIRRYGEAGHEICFDYFREKPWMKPIVLEPHEDMAIAGRVLGIKGQALVIEKGSTLYAIDLDDLIGYDVVPGKGFVKLQTSLLEYS